MSILANSISEFGIPSLLTFPRKTWQCNKVQFMTEDMLLFKICNSAAVSKLPFALYNFILKSDQEDN